MMPLAVLYKIATQPKMNLIKERVSACANTTAIAFYYKLLGLTTFQNPQIGQVFVNPANF
jgi:hypothetical protein